MTHETAHPDEKTTEPAASLEESAFDAAEETIEATPSNIEAEAAVSLDAMLTPAAFAPRISPSASPSQPDEPRYSA